MWPSLRHPIRAYRRALRTAPHPVWATLLFALSAILVIALNTLLVIFPGAYNAFGYGMLIVCVPFSAALACFSPPDTTPPRGDDPDDQPPPWYPGLWQTPLPREPKARRPIPH